MTQPDTSNFRATWRPCRYCGSLTLSRERVRTRRWLPAGPWRPVCSSCFDRTLHRELLKLREAE